MLIMTTELASNDWKGSKHVVHYYILIKNMAIPNERSDCIYCIHQENWHFILRLSDQI